jgi:transcriptional regulator with XRE-family HTH domain
VPRTLSNATPPVCKSALSTLLSGDSRACRLAKNRDAEREVYAALALLATGSGRVEYEEREVLGALLKRCRVRIAPEQVSLGPYLRLPIRIGKMVTQEEVAEAAGMTRQWYGLMERDCPVRVSAAALSRVADTLMMDAAERATLFRLALPELRSTSLVDRSVAVLDAFKPLRDLTRRLWTASSEAEALTLAREYAMTQFAPDAMVTSTRIADGSWDVVATGGDAERVKCFHTLFIEKEGAGVAMMEDLYSYTLLAQPGELMTRAERDTRFPELDVKVRRALAMIDWADVSFTLAHVRSQSGFIARLVPLYDTAHESSEIERAQLSTLANVTSLALSGCVSSSQRAPA